MRNESYVGVYDVCININFHAVQSPVIEIIADFGRILNSSADGSPGIYPFGGVSIAVYRERYRVNCRRRVVSAVVFRRVARYKPAKR